MSGKLAKMGNKLSKKGVKLPKKGFPLHTYEVVMPIAKNIAGIFAFCIVALIFTSASHAREKRSADLIAYGDYVLTMREGEEIIQKGAIAVDDGVIVAVGPAVDIDMKFSADQTIPGQNRVLLPGLVNGHTHSSMVTFRGLADDLPLMEWLQEHIFPAEGRYVDAELVRAGTRLACWEMIKSGTSTFVDMYFYPDVIAEVVADCGLRAVVAAPMIDYPSPGFIGWDDSFKEGVAFVRRWKGRNSRITPALAPHAPYTVSDVHLKQAFAAARELDVPISIHVAEDRSEVAYVRDKYQTSSVQLLAGFGMLSQRTVAAHMVWPTNEDIAAMVGTPVGAIHNPTSNMKAAAGLSPVPMMLAAGVSVGLGTDGAASNNDLDIWQEMRMAALLHKGMSGDATAVSATEALVMATRGGSKATGFEGVNGELTIGLQADFIQVDISSPRFAPLYDIVSHLVYVAKSTDVVTNVVAGKPLMLDGKVVSIDGVAAADAVNAIATKIRSDRKTNQ